MEGKRVLYIEVHQLKKQGLRITQIAKKTKLLTTAMILIQRCHLFDPPMISI